jgi:hypothetical protein
VEGKSSTGATTPGVRIVRNCLLGDLDGVASVVVVGRLAGLAEPSWMIIHAIGISVSHDRLSIRMLAIIVTSQSSE